MPIRAKGSSGASDHGALTGLADDDHTQYILVDGSRAFTGTVSLGSNRLNDVGAVTMPSGASDPFVPTPVTGDVYYNTSDTTIRRYNGATWDVYSSAGTDHGGLTGLTDDDHTQYILVDGTRAFTGDIDVGGNKISNIGEFVLPSGASNPSAPDTGQVYWNTSDTTFRRYNGTGWELLESGTSNHGALNGLSDDDHSQYILVDGTRPFTGDFSVGGGRLYGAGSFELPSFASDPGSPATGDVYWNTGDSSVRRYNGSIWDSLSGGGGGSGDVVGPASSVDNTLPRYDSTTGKLIQTSGIVVDDSDGMTGITSAVINHTATENDDYAFEIICDAAGFGDVKALDIDYITGAVAGGETEEAVLTNVDESASTGGRVAAFEALTTDLGSAEVDGLRVGLNVNPIQQTSGTFVDTDSLLVLAVDQLTALSSGGAGNISVFVADNDTVTIGNASTFAEIEIVIDTAASNPGISPTFEYSTGVGTWATFSPADGTNGFRNTGVIAWSVGDISWAVGTGSEYLIRITRTRNSMSTTPIIDLVQVGGDTSYCWDKLGDLKVRGVELADMAAPSNPGAGLGALYKKTSDDGLFWKPDAAGAEVDLTNTGTVGEWLHEIAYRVNTSSSNWVTMDKTRYFDATWANTSGAQSGTPVFSQNDSGWTVPYDCTVTDVIITFQPAVSSATAAMRFGVYRSRPNYGSTDVPAVGVIVAGTDMTHTTLSSTYLVSVGNGLTLGAGVDLDQHDQIIPVTGSNGTANDCYGTMLIKIEPR